MGRRSVLQENGCSNLFGLLQPFIIIFLDLPRYTFIAREWLL